MTDKQHDTTETGIAVLADDADAELPLTVRGVALGEDDVTHGASETRVHWPRETLEAATDDLVGRKLVDDSAHDIPEDGDLPTEPPTRSIVGEVTDARYKPGVGVLYEGEIDDPDIADLVRNGRVDVSPFVIRRLGDRDEERDALQAEEILHWRDLAVVANGASEGASIEPASSAAEALSTSALADALGAAFEGDDGDGTDAQADDESAESDATPDDPAGDDADTTPTGDDPSDGASTPDTDTPDSSMDLTDSEEALVRTARTLDDPSVVEADVEALADEMESYDDPHVVEADDYDALAERVETVRSVLADALAERTGMQSETAEALSLDALMGEFETDDGEFDAEALVQSPEAGGTDDDPADPNGADVDQPDDGLDALSDEERADIESKLTRADTLEAVDPEYADSLREDAAEAAGVETHDDIDMEAL